ncbi:MAG: hypothetical protein IJP75_04930 [Bacteroidaceae bacterium]|nr:hypothetical protein [Bacteroidaceae bacterium]
MMETFCFSEEKSHLDVGTSTLQLCDESISSSASGADVIDDNHTFSVEEPFIEQNVVIDVCITMQMQFCAFANNLNVLEAIQVYMTLQRY